MWQEGLPSPFAAHWRSCNRNGSGNLMLITNTPHRLDFFGGPSFVEQGWEPPCWGAFYYCKAENILCSCITVCYVSCSIVGSSPSSSVAIHLMNGFESTRGPLSTPVRRREGACSGSFCSFSCKAGHIYIQKMHPSIQKFLLCCCCFNILKLPIW